MRIKSIIACMCLCPYVFGVCVCNIRYMLRFVCEGVSHRRIKTEIDKLFVCFLSDSLLCAIFSRLGSLARI